MYSLIGDTVVWRLGWFRGKASSLSLFSSSYKSLGLETLAGGSSKIKVTNELGVLFENLTIMDRSIKCC